MTLSTDALAQLRSLAERGDHVVELLVQILDGENPQATLAAKHAVAISKPTVHQQADPTVTGAALTAGTVLSDALVRATALHVALLTHAADGSATASHDAPHKIAHTGATVTALKAGAPTDLTTLEAWCDLAAAFIVAHGNATGVHFASDTGTSGTGFTLTNASPNTQAKCNTDINDIQTAYNAHVALASPVA